MSYILSTSSTADMPIEFFQDRDIHYVPFTYIIDEKEFKDDLGQTMSYDEFFDRIDKGAMPTTSQVRRSTSRSTSSARANCPSMKKAKSKPSPKADWPTTSPAQPLSLLPTKVAKSHAKKSTSPSSESHSASTPNCLPTKNSRQNCSSTL